MKTSNSAYRSAVVSAISMALALGAACAGDTVDADGDEHAAAVTAATGARLVAVEREHLVGDVYHHAYLLDAGDGANAQVRVHRVVREASPWRARRTGSAIMLMHGDFATFTSNFLPSLADPATPPGAGLAVYLAEQDVDVWGLDRRWTQAAGDAPDLSDYPGMGYAQAVGDGEQALRFARLVRLVTGSGPERLIVGGFSRGGHIAYHVAAADAARPAWQRQVRGLVPIDVYAVIAPEDEALRQGACARRDEAQAALDMGVVENHHGFFVDLATFARTAPDDPSPIFDGYTNRAALQAFVGQTYVFFGATPAYHLIGASFDEAGMPLALSYSADSTVIGWLASAPLHGAMAELRDGDALWCGEGAAPVAAPLAGITVPVFYLGAAGGFGDHGLYTTTRRLHRRHHARRAPPRGRERARGFRPRRSALCR